MAGKGFGSAARQSMWLVLHRVVVGHLLGLCSMIRENQQLVTSELVEFEN